MQFIQQVGTLTLVIYASGNSKVAGKLKAPSSLRGIAGHLLVSRVEIIDPMRWVDIVGEAKDVKW